MRWVIDSCTIIYLVKSKLFDFFCELSNFPINIDTSVHYEVIDQGIENQYQDALDAKAKIEKNKIPIIPTNISSSLHLVGNAGETSCYLLCKEDGITITSDKRAYNKFKNLDVPVIKLEQFFIQNYYQNNISELKLNNILDKLENIYAITPKQHLELKKILEIERLRKNDQKMGEKNG